MKKILIYNTGGGIGDSIQIINLILSLKKKFKNYELYLLTSNQEYFFENKLKITLGLNNETEPALASGALDTLLATAGAAAVSLAI